MSTVASDLSEDQRERERFTSSLFLREMNVSAYTFESVTVFVQLFCTPKSSMENPSLRLSGHASSTNRTFIVGDYAEDDFGQWAKNEVTGEQGYIDDDRSCFWTWDDTERALQSRPFKGRQVKRIKGKGKGKGKGRSTRTGRAFFCNEQVQDPEWWSKRTLLGGPKERKARKAC